MSYVVYGKADCSSYALYYCNDTHSYHSLCRFVRTSSVSKQSREDVSEEIHLVVVDLHV